jgi:hypothetical protein
MDENTHRQLYEKYGKIMKITGLPGIKNIVMVFDPDDVEKVSVCINGAYWAYFMTQRANKSMFCKKNKPPVYSRASKELSGFLRECLRHSVTYILT